MSTGGTIPYHLRQNKAIERNLFVDLLARVGRYNNISEYTYVGFGGPFLEDFKHLHSALRISRMISIEMDENVYYRQVFNQPVSCVDLLHLTSGEFVDSCEFSGPTIVWFDYATPDIGSQLVETQRLVEKLGHGDIFKITVNANAQTLGSKAGVSIHEYRARQAVDRLGDYGPAEIDEDMVSRANYPTLLLGALLSAARRGVASTPEHVVQPLTSFCYSDGTIMLTFTGIVLKSDSVDEFGEKSRLRHWKFSNLSCDEPQEISVPSFSVKERLKVESLLPQKDAENITKELGYYIGDDVDTAHSLMENFVDFYRLYPWYSKVVF
ncbi:hypothetical protein HT749_17395 [Burkholderia cepacia]|uniref:O-methyltransferase n=1 Tax=Burkholderia cepacia TaxID=292 RepID=UPI00157B619A|nr:O-methyltransferase [Burkholderia cepacia]NTX45180.1 hypothetical protein [Burkholderia cepacia]